MRKLRFGKYRSWNAAFVIVQLLLVPALIMTGCSGKEPSGPKNIAIILEDRLAVPLGEVMEEYVSALEKDGFKVIVKDSFASSSKPAEIRACLQGLHGKDRSLEGAIFIGNLPSIVFNTPEEQGNPYKHDHLCDFYYMDLDGVWKDADGNNVYDTHVNYKAGILNKITNAVNRIMKVFPGRLTPEIWVSRIRSDTLASLGDETGLIREYLRKNIQYRSGKLPLPRKRAFVVAPGIDVLRSDWGARPQKIYSEADVFQCRGNSSVELRKYLASKEGYELGIVNVFSGPGIHHFDYFEGKRFDDSLWSSAEGLKRINEYSDTIHEPYDISTRDIQAIKPNVLFYHLITSEVGRHDRAGYLAGAYIFSGMGLAAVAGTQHSGSIAVPVFYDFLASGASIGEAWENSIRWSIENSGKKIDIYWCDRKENWIEGKDPYKAVLIGDGTLRLPPGKGLQGGS